MKKLFYGAALMFAALTFTSCGNTEMCYKVTTTYKLLGEEISTVEYLWVTKNQLNKTKKLRSRYLSEYEYQLLMKLFDADVIYMIEDGREYQQVILKTTNLLRNNKQFYQIEIDVELM